MAHELSNEERRKRKAAEKIKYQGLLENEENAQIRIGQFGGNWQSLPHPPGRGSGKLSCLRGTSGHLESPVFFQNQHGSFSATGSRFISQPNGT